MIIFLTLLYVGILFLLVKLKVIKLTPFWKASPAIWVCLLLIFLFIPMQWGAPQGNVNLYQFVLEIIPNVNGEVTKVDAVPFKPMKKGDPIFRIDPTVYQATVESLKAQLSLAKLRLKQAEALASKKAGSQFEVESYQATVKQLKAQLESANWNLKETVVRAPADGYIIALTLQKGQRVSNMPLRSWVTFVRQKKIPIVWIPQNFLRHVEPGQEVEVSWNLRPGKIFKGSVKDVGKIIGQGQYIPTGIAPTAPQPNVPGLYPVVIKLDMEKDLLDETLYGGAFGTGAIYTSSSTFAHLIRRVILRIAAWLNYVLP